MDRPELRKEDLEALYELAAELLRLEEEEPMLDAVVQRSLELLQADRGFLVLCRDGASELDFAVVRNWSREELEQGSEPVSRSIVTEALRHGEPLLVEDASHDLRFAKKRSVLEMGIRSVLCAPLEVDGRLAGALYLESRSARRLFGPGDLALFERVLGLASRVLSASARRLLQEPAPAGQELLRRHDFSGIVTQDPGFLQVLATVARVAASEMPVLIQGPSGAGKELVAAALHRNSARASAPFLTVNCGAISPQLLESELFGHVRGAFTGATSDKAGLLRQAAGGTLFLDEIGELPRDLQVKLLRTLQFGEIQPVGAAKAQTVDLRFVAATNRDLEQEVKEGRFREDLLYRLNAITLEIPPLRSRPGDILPLFHHFLGRAAAKAGRPAPKLSAALERLLQQYEWPGNVRELENEAARLVVLWPPDRPLPVDSLSPRIQQSVVEKLTSLDSLRSRDKEQIEEHLRLAGGNRSAAARSLGISREGLRLKTKRLGML